jgi:hypothetical protein
VNGRLDERDGEPRAIIDGREYTWEELGRFLSLHSGFNFRLECFEPHDDPPIAAHPVHPHPLWWLDLGADEEPDTKEQARHH